MIRPAPYCPKRVVSLDLEPRVWPASLDIAFELRLPVSLATGYTIAGTLACDNRKTSIVAYASRSIACVEFITCGTTDYVGTARGEFSFLLPRNQEGVHLVSMAEKRPVFGTSGKYDDSHGQSY